eukprot:CAMPEP_0202961892 /NCGR_PEP_ID=MMETSP1396-20130829/5990_1 /ASSEMBLY_ACC=CAM_ASM_000872 /TAXON_ID= /ORGANISM="Pseudokeronopsis sp., Strain Brazil" /LENGTH=172 /DNA_ID=CAMNT_0049682091 /DNA_START=146 /DNA_END=664 /DNA_ORIENTATION=+
MIVSNGGHYPGMSEDKRSLLLQYESVLVHLQLQLEDVFVELSEYYRRQGENVVLVYDRGMMDVKAYAPADIWESLLTQFNVTEAILTSRYDIVIHLVTAADGAEGFYTSANNAARIETAEQARELDSRTFDCWKAHSHLFRIENKPLENSFSVKVNEAVGTLKEFLEKRLEH